MMRTKGIEELPGSIARFLNRSKRRDYSNRGTWTQEDIVTIIAFLEKAKERE